LHAQVDWDKGTALVHLLCALGLDDPSRVFALYVGDDRTDEDAFKGERRGTEGWGGFKMVRDAMCCVSRFR
jgi:trehalose 6-phosphate phosphatase